MGKLRQTKVDDISCYQPSIAVVYFKFTAVIPPVSSLYIQ